MCCAVPVAFFQFASSYYLRRHTRLSRTPWGVNTRCTIPNRSSALPYSSSADKVPCSADRLFNRHPRVSCSDTRKDDPTSARTSLPRISGAALKTFGVAVNEQILFSRRGYRSCAARVKGEYTTKARSQSCSRVQASRRPNAFRSTSDSRPQDPVSPQASTQAQVDGQGAANSADNEDKKSFFDRFRLAQVGSGKTASEASVNQKDEQASKRSLWFFWKKSSSLARAHPTAKEGAQDVKIYTREKIEQSGQTTGFRLPNTLPDVSRCKMGSPNVSFAGMTTVSSCMDYPLEHVVLG